MHWAPKKISTVIKLDLKIKSIMTKNIMLLIVYKKGSKKGYVLHYRTTSKEGTYPNILTSYNTLVYKICRISMRTIYSDFKM